MRYDNLRNALKLKKKLLLKYSSSKELQRLADISIQSDSNLLEALEKTNEQSYRLLDRKCAFLLKEFTGGRMDDLIFLDRLYMELKIVAGSNSERVGVGM